MARLCMAGLFLFSLTACQHARLGHLTQIDWVPSPNFDDRRANFIVIHGTSNHTMAAALRTLIDPERKVSAHYLIGRSGEVIQLVDERQRAWHAGASRWGMLTDLNSASIGIELDNNGEEPFPDVQIESLLLLLRDLRERHRIPAANVIGHGDIAPRRKIDPSRHFPWRRLAKEGFGLWCDEPAPVPPSFDALLGLRAFGYDTADVEAAVLAFRRHFAGADGPAELDQADRAMLSCLLALPRPSTP